MKWIKELLSIIRNKKHFDQTENTVDIKKTAIHEKRILIVIIAFIVLLLTLVLYLVYFQLFKAEKLIKNEYNSRNLIDESLITRGKIYDKNGIEIVTNAEDENGNSTRIYNYSQIDAPITGYNSKSYGKSGLEKTYNKYLLNTQDTPSGKLKQMVLKSDVGNDLHLSLDQNLQTSVYNHMQGITGSCILMNPKTGQILAMVSLPTYNPNSIDTDWNMLIQNEDGILLNRATQGNYRPGSTMKVVSATAILDNNIDPYYNDTGKEVIQGYEINNYANNVFGNLDLRAALVNSANTYFAKKVNDMGKEDFKTVCERFMFNKEFDFDLDHIESTIPFASLNQVDLAMTGFGYGKTEVSPLHMVMIASSIANGGRMMKPYLVESIENKEKKNIYNAEPKVLSEVTTAENANKLKDMLISVVNNGTGSNAFVSGLNIAGKTGTADVKDNRTDCWFIGFAPADNPSLAIVVMAETNGLTGAEACAPIAGRILSDAIYTYGY